MFGGNRGFVFGLVKGRGCLVFIGWGFGVVLWLIFFLVIVLGIGNLDVFFLRDRVGDGVEFGDFLDVF